MNGRTNHAALIGISLAFFCAGCSKSPSEPAVSVSADCQRFIDKYFEAFKSKDIGKLQEYSSASYSSLFSVPAGGTEMPANVADMGRENAKKIVADSYEQTFRRFGDFKSCSVVRAKETTIPTADRDAPQMMRAGIHAEIVCKAKFSRNDGLIQLNLFKEKQDSEYSIEGWRYEGHL